MPQYTVTIARQITEWCTVPIQAFSQEAANIKAKQFTKHLIHAGDQIAFIEAAGGSYGDDVDTQWNVIDVEESARPA